MSTPSASTVSSPTVVPDQRTEQPCFRTKVSLLLGFLGQAAPIGILQRLEALELGRGDDHGHRAAVALDADRLTLGVVQELAEALLGLLGGHGLHRDVS